MIISEISNEYIVINGDRKIYWQELKSILNELKQYAAECRGPVSNIELNISQIMQGIHS